MANGQNPFLFNYDYFDEARQFGQGQVGWFIVRVSDPSKAAEIARSIDKVFENSANETRTATEAESAREFANQFGNIGLMMGGILGAVFFTIILLTGNTMAQAFRERVPELAVLKTLGFSDARVSLLVLGEAVLLTLVGGALGLGIAALLAPGVAKGIKEILPTFAIAWQTIAQRTRPCRAAGSARWRGAGVDRTQTAHRRCATGALTMLGQIREITLMNLRNRAGATRLVVGDRRRHRGRRAGAGIDPRDGGGIPPDARFHRCARSRDRVARWIQR